MASASTLRSRSTLDVLVANILRYARKNIRSSSKAFLITYIYIVLPKLVTRILKIFATDKWKVKREWIKVLHLLRNATRSDKFPFFFFKLVFTLNATNPLIQILLSSLIKDKLKLRVLSLFCAGFLSSSINFPTFQRTVIAKHRFYSLDLSLFIIIRSLDTVVSSIASGHSKFTSTMDIASFTISSFLIMRAWFYYPERLPPAYRNWITRAANMDYELIKALNLLHHEKLFYGKESPNDDVLYPLCDRVGLDRKLGNPSLTYPIPCEIVHSNMTSNCEMNALLRFLRGVKFASGIYVPLNVILVLISFLSGRQRNLKKLLTKSLLSTLRSTTFLASFIAFNWYPICLVRNKVGPYLNKTLPTGWVNPNFDKSFAPTAGCAMSGLSSIIETPKRRRDLFLFCAPKALLTVIPLEPTQRNLQIESWSFSLFFAILVCYAKISPTKVRGIYGTGLAYLLKE